MIMSIEEMENKITRLEEECRRSKNTATIAAIQSEISQYKIMIREAKSVPAKKKEAIVQKDNPVVADHVEPSASSGFLNSTDGKFVAKI